MFLVFFIVQSLVLKLSLCSEDQFLRLWRPRNKDYKKGRKPPLFHLDPAHCPWDQNMPLVDPTFVYLMIANQPCSLVLNKPVNPVPCNQVSAL